MNRIEINNLNLEAESYINGYITPIQSIFGKLVNLLDIKDIPEINENFSDVELHIILNNDDGFIFTINKEIFSIFHKKIYKEKIEDIEVEFNSMVDKTGKNLQLYYEYSSIDFDDNYQMFKVTDIYFIDTDIVSSKKEEMKKIRKEIINRWNKMLFLKLGINLDLQENKIQQRLNSIS